MILDFSQICNTYDKNLYTKDSFAATPCPKCPAVGRFKLHGSYQRHALYFADNKLIFKKMDIQRIICKSCKSTHAVMPGDLIPYKLLTLYVVILVFTGCIVEKKPVLSLAEKYGFSFQFIYYCLLTFAMHRNHIHQYFMETSPTDTPPDTSPEIVMSLIKEPYLQFQLGYTKLNRRPCFMCKFFTGGGGPPIGIHAA